MLQTLKDGVSKIRRRHLTSTVTVRVVEDCLAETQLHIMAAAPQLVVTDWPAGEDERALLKSIVVESPCTVVLWGGYSPTANANTTFPGAAQPSRRPSNDFEPRNNSEGSLRSRPVLQRSGTQESDPTRSTQLVARGCGPGSRVGWHRRRTGARA